MSHTVLVVPVPALEPFVRGRWEHYDPALVSTDPAFTHAHVTALAPFVPAPTESDLARVARIAATTPAFEFTLAEVRAFPDGVVHAPAEPSAPFTRLTGRLWEEFPDHPPYEGRYDAVLPHLTLDRLSAEVSLGSVGAALGDLLPVRCPAQRLELHRYGAGECRVEAVWPFAGPSTF